MTICTGKRFFRGITVLLGAVMLLSCRNDLKEVSKVTIEDKRPEMLGEELVMIYSDSAKIKYKMITSEYIKVNREKEKYEEFPKGIYLISYDPDGKVIGSIKAKYAKKMEDEMIWEARNEVVVTNADGNKLETELLFWNWKTEKIYSDRYSRLTADGQIIEGNNGFESDQNLKTPVFFNITGQVEVEKKP